ncbi:MAG: isochorismatase family protein [Proteobacteria bacterium]|nr:isochorismatase family protein [Pseudomonadota bacterium]
MLDPIFDFDRDILPPEAARALLLEEMLGGNLGALITDMQWGYFFPEYMKANGRFCDAAIKEAQTVTATTHTFFNDYKATGLPLHKFWAVHACFPSVRHKLQTNPTGIRRELVIKPDAEDEVFTKEEPCPFQKTPLNKAARKKRVSTFLKGGGLFEVCVAHGLLNGMHKYDYNMILMPDATLTKHGRGVDYIRGQFRYATGSLAKIKLGVLDTREVMDVAHTAAKLSLGHLRAA